MSEDMYDEYPSLTLAKEQQQESIEPLKLGKRIKEIRMELSLTLEDASKRTGLARSTLSKIENEQISPTFQAMQKLAAGLNIDMPQLFEPPRKKVATGRRDVTLSGQGKPHPTPTYEHELLATQLSNKKMMPFKSRIHARNFDDYSDWVRHDGEEFLLILEGDVLLYTEFYEPVPLKSGDSVYYDANMGHMLVSTSEEDAHILWVTAK
ncbi:XRE family transcriptional regulator [Vibrio tapetis subsp. quintayensis]|uniref:helix-turn-helix domain-containing protein n=1 Tax=Vibrio tapetis TaxID=52443 RepID=UPI0025B41086|nr:XRE family transcriptional regulator [Vibrio tapetis]MDN3680603.1 XRE family transcriptional regulator [Vibrio tapetis subsp. quintayensis]